MRTVSLRSVYLAGLIGLLAGCAHVRSIETVAQAPTLETPEYLDEKGCDNKLGCSERCVMVRVYSAKGRPATWSYCTENPPARKGPPPGWIYTGTAK